MLGNYSTYPSDVRNSWMMFDRHEEQLKPIKELDTTRRRDTHVQKYSEKYRHWHQSQKIGHQHWQTDQQRDEQGTQTLFYKKNNMIILWYFIYCFYLIYLPLTSTICGASPGACVLDMTVKAATWVTERTVAAQCQGAPMTPQTALRIQITTMSIWKPEPFFKFLSGLSMINLEKKNKHRCNGNNLLYSIAKIWGSKI